MDIPPDGNLILVRHGEPERVREPGGRYVERLSARGAAQVAAIGDALAASGVRCVLFCSPAPRSVAAAAAIGRINGCPVHVDDELRELSLGIDHSGGRASAERVWARLRASVDEPAWPGGESVTELQARMLAAVRGALRSNPGTRIVLVTHAAMIDLLGAALAGLPVGEMPAERVAHGEVQTWRVRADPDHEALLEGECLDRRTPVA